MSDGAWGPWSLDKRTRVLWTEAGGYYYEIDLDTCTTSAQVLDWICQIASKTWGSSRGEHDAITAGLAEAFIDILSPQSRLCSGGADKRLTLAGIRERVAKARQP